MPATRTDIASNARDYARIEAAILYLEAHFRDQPSLATVAREAGLGPHHFQRLFRRWAGISPKRFGQYLTLDYAKAQLDASASILDATYDAGLSGPARLHDLFVTYEAMSPGAFKRRGAGIDIAWGVHPSPFGPCFAGLTARGICALGFADGDGSAVRAEFEGRWPAARFREDRAATAAVVARIFGERPGRRRAAPPRRRRHQLPAQGVGGAAPHSPRPDHLLPGAGTGARAAAQRPRGGRRRRRQSGLLPDPLPPRHPGDGPHLELRVGPRPQARHAGLGGRALRAS